MNSVSTELPNANGRVHRKLLASGSVKLRVAAACLTLLLLGAWLRPQTAAPLMPPQERPAPLLDEQIQRSASDFRGIEDQVAALRARGVVVQPDPRGPIVNRDFGRTVAAAPSVFAVAVSEAYFVTHASALAGGRPPTLTDAGGASLPTTVAAFDPATSLVLLSSPSAAAVMPVFADAIASPGSLVVGAARSNAIDVAIPLFITAVNAQAYGVGGGNSAPPGLPIYNLDGGLLAISGGDGSAWRIRYALDRLLAQAATGSLPSSLGVTYQSIDARLAASIGASGLVITGVAPGGPADAAGLEAGDVITAIGSPGVKGENLNSELAMLRAGSPAQLQVWRAGKSLAVTVTPAFAHEMAATPDATPLAGPEASALFAREALAASSVPPDAIVGMIDGRTVNSAAQAQRELRRTRDAAVVLLEHRGRRFFATIESRR